MALTVTVLTPQKEQLQSSPYGTAQYMQVATVQYDNSYPSGGYAITPSQFNMNGVLGMIQIANTAATPTIAYYDNQAQSLRVYGYTVTNTSAIAISSTLSTLVEVPIGSAVLNGVSRTFLIIGF
jgi:hypothetical protein